MYRFKYYPDKNLFVYITLLKVCIFNKINNNVIHTKLLSNKIGN